MRRLLTLLALLLACGDDARSEAPTEDEVEPREAEPDEAEPQDDQADEGDDQAGEGDDFAAETLEQLEALGYFPSAPTDNPEDRGVTTLVEDAIAPGVNLYSTRHRASAILIDHRGVELHRWTDPEEDPSPWMHVEPLGEGELLAVTMNERITRLTWDSSVAWQRRIPGHHDLAVHGDTIYALARYPDHITHQGQRIRILADQIALLSLETGEVQRRVPLVPLFRDRLSPRRLARIVRRTRDGDTAGTVRDGGLADVMHTNSIHFLTEDIEGVAPAGSVLLSFRALDRIAILDAGLEEVLWSWGPGELSGQHDAKQLPGGHLMVFDNGTRDRQTRVVELDAARGEIVWQYTDDEFFTQLRGGAQRLDNGNTLCTESDSGHVFEVTREGRVVWDFWNPDVRGRGENAERGVIYRLNRFPPAEVMPRANEG